MSTFQPTRRQSHKPIRDMVSAAANMAEASLHSSTGMVVGTFRTLEVLVSVAYNAADTFRITETFSNAEEKEAVVDTALTNAYNRLEEVLLMPESPLKEERLARAHEALARVKTLIKENL